jgi:hypothetical protein
MTAQRKPASPVIKISPISHAKLQALAATENRSMGEIANELIDRYDEEQFWTRVRAQLARLKADPVAWNDYMQEIAEWDAMGSDGLENEEPYYSTEEEEEILANAAHSEGR